jgi:hypothetical protein
LLHKVRKQVVAWGFAACSAAGYLPRGKLKDACQRFGIAYSTAANAVMVCKKFESSNRLELLGFKHHMYVAGDEDATELLTWAADNEATVEELRTEKKRRSVTAPIEADTSTSDSLDSLIQSGRKFGIAYDTALQSVRVCRAFESCNRLQDVSFERSLRSDQLEFPHRKEIASCRGAIQTCG